MINWTVRLKNKTFWMTAIPAVLLLVQSVLALFGVVIDYENIGNGIMTIVNAVFTLLAVLGIVTDPTTDGVGDSKLAMTYTAPKKDPEEDDTIG